METKDRRENLCDTCESCFAECMPNEIEFSEGYGNDNVIKCSGYTKKAEVKNE